MACLVTYPLSRFATGWLAKFLQRYTILDRPNHRSSHTRPVPRGGGIVVIGMLVLAWGHLGLLVPYVMPALFTILGCTLALAALSWIDDLRGLNPFLRLFGQAIAVVIGLWALPDAPVFQGIFVPWVDSVMVAVLWLWFINLFNFMDGIDGITAAETVAIGLGILLISVLVDLGPDVAFYGLTLATVTLGFLKWNWQPAKIFLGDVGSVPLGFLVGWLLLTMAAAGQWVPALILPLYYFADATITLLQRLVRGEKVWLAHRSHFYQQATKGPGTHAGAVQRINATNIVLVVLAGVAAMYPEIAQLLILFAGLIVAVLLWTFAKHPIEAPKSISAPTKD
jgi:UDP-N-acetylmuramyl pentapeptide phosphotransferase/UDP-N-acetylglucosamine-1-phosphate transferase